MNVQVLEQPLPQLRLPVIDDDDAEDAGGDHVHHVLVFEGIGDRCSFISGLPALRKSVQRFRLSW